MATCPDKALRDAPRAVTLAEQAARSMNYADASTLDTLAAAYAESGAFEKAVMTQRKAIELTPATSRSDLQKRLDLYLSGQPYHSS